MPEIFFTSDLHFGHDNIIDYASRPFYNQYRAENGQHILLKSRLEIMHVTLIHNWNATVAPSDIVIIVGDFAMGAREKNVLMAAQLNGTKVLVPGNHDYIWAGNSAKRIESWKPLYDQYFSYEIPSEVSDLWEDNLDINHFPFTNDRPGVDRYAKYRPIDNGQWLIHGHVHDLYQTNGRCINVSAEVWNYAPVNLKTLIELKNRLQMSTNPAKTANKL